MKRASGLWIVGLFLAAGCGGGVSGTESDGGTPQPPPVCTGGTDKDSDGYGPGCPAGPDCNDGDAAVNPGQKEACDGKDNNCDGQIDENNACGGSCPGCGSSGNGTTPFPNDPKTDPNLKDANGVKLDPNGDLTLDAAMVNFNYLWIANTYDMAGDDACDDTPANPALCRGSLSKVDTVKMAEVARYYTVTCASKSGPTGCSDVNGRALTLHHNHTPSRTAVDFNFDCWVANRNVHGGQQSATKVANDPADCIDRNGNGKIDTSKDQNGDGKITVDCNADGKPDDGKTVCAGTLAGKPPEFLGDDDECILFTVAYGDKDDLGRSICLDTGKNNIGASNAWVGTFSRPENGRGNNRFYGINGNTGKIEAEVELPAGHHTYGCMADANHIIWSTDIGSGSKWNGSLAYFSSLTKQAGPVLRGPSAANAWKDADGQYHHYGITVNADQHVWLGGWSSSWVLRYKPDRTSFDTLSKGSWTRVDLKPGWHTRGIAADNRGKIWVSIHEGYLFRLEQSLPDGIHNKKNPVENVDYWATKAQTVIGSGVDFNGHLWGVGHSNDTASRLDVDAKGNVIAPSTGKTKFVSVGKNPYTYSDFTGYGLMNFVRPQGRWVYQHKGCQGDLKATWQGVTWNATTPPGTQVIVRVRSGDSETTMGQWSQEFAASPASFGPSSAQPLSPNPATYLQVEFTLKNTTKDTTPILHDYKVSFVCAGSPD